MQELRSTGGNCQGDDRQERADQLEIVKQMSRQVLRSSAGSYEAAEQTGKTQLSRP